MIGQGILTYGVLRKGAGGSRDMGHLGGGICLPYGINNQQEVVGYSKTRDRRVVGFLYRNGRLMSLGSLTPGGHSGAHGINDKTEVVGSSTVGMNVRSPMHAFLYRNGRMIDLGTLGGTTSNARAINNRSVIVGVSKLADGSKVGCLWHQGERHDLNKLIPAANGWVVRDAFKINEHDQIAAIGVKNGVQHALLLTPEVAKPRLADR